MSSINSVNHSVLYNLQHAAAQKAGGAQDPDHDGDTDKPGVVDQDAGQSNSVINTQNGLDIIG